MNQPKVATFGEIMLRLSPLMRQQPIIATKALEMAFAGAESTVAVNLAFWGTPAKFITALPENDLGKAARNNVREHGVDTSAVCFRSGRMGTYYIEYGASIRSAKVLYDRANSAIAQAAVDYFDWETIFRDCTHFFTSGITPALSTSCAEICRMAFKKAKEKGLTTCFDLNYRRSLWSADDAREAYLSFLPYVDMLIGNAGAAYDVFGITVEDTESYSMLSVAQQFRELSPATSTIALTIREQVSASQNSWSGFLDDGKKSYRSRVYDIEIVERLGGGDAFTAGILLSHTRGWSSQKAVDFSTAASALKHTIPGDLCLVSEQDILEVAQGAISGHIKR